MRLSPEDIEKLFRYIRDFLLNFGIDLPKVEELVKKFVRFLKQNERAVVSRIKLRICQIRDEIESKPIVRKEDKVVIRTLNEVIKIIEEEERRIDFSDF